MLGENDASCSTISYKHPGSSLKVLHKTLAGNLEGGRLESEGVGWKVWAGKRAPPDWKVAPAGERGPSGDAEGILDKGYFYDTYLVYSIPGGDYYNDYMTNRQMTF